MKLAVNYSSLPLAHLREIHITGIQYVDEHSVGILECAQLPRLVAMMKQEAE